MTIAAIAFRNTGPIENPGIALVPGNRRIRSVRAGNAERTAGRAAAFFRGVAWNGRKTHWQPRLEAGAAVKDANGPALRAIQPVGRLSTARVDGDRQFDRLPPRGVSSDSRN
jgi:hypothetical protein